MPSVTNANSVDRFPFKVLLTEVVVQVVGLVGIIVLIILVFSVAVSDVYRGNLVKIRDIAIEIGVEEVKEVHDPVRDNDFILSSIYTTS